MVLIDISYDSDAVGCSLFIIMISLLFLVLFAFLGSPIVMLPLSISIFLPALCFF